MAGHKNFNRPPAESTIVEKGEAMAEAEMKNERTIRPRVLSAVLRLKRFTVQEVVSAASLKDVKQAYVQLSKLEKSGFLTSSQYRAQDPERSINLYSIVEDKQKQADLSAIAAQYGLQVSAPPSASLFRDALSAATLCLDEVDGELSSIDLTEASSKSLVLLSVSIDNLNRQLDDVQLDLETAKVEGADGMADVELQLITHRLSAVRELLKASRAAIFRRHSALVIKQLVSGRNRDGFGTTVENLRKRLAVSESSFSNEIVCDLLSPALHRKDMMPLLLTSYAMRTQDLKLIYYCLDRYQSQTHSHWWHYNLLSINFLLGRFKRVYDNIQKALANVVSLQHRRSASATCRVFLYEPNQLTQEGLSPLLNKYEVSLVSPSALPFWNWTENVICPLLVEPMSERGPLTGTVLLKGERTEGPLWKLFAYGPLSSEIQQWPGAPPLRVAAGLRHFLNVDFEIQRVADALRNRKGVIVIQDHQAKDSDAVQGDVRSALHKCEEVSLATNH